MQRLDNYFRGLAEASRLRIVNLLLQRELCVCDIQRILNLTQPSASRHLSYLKHAGLVADRRDGLRVFYRLTGSSTRARLMKSQMSIFSNPGHLPVQTHISSPGRWAAI